MARGRPSKKQHILENARQLFAELGYQGTSIDLVVQQAGVSKPTVYNNFPTKQHLLLALAELMLAEISAARETIGAELDPVAAAISAYRQLAGREDWLALLRIGYGERHKLDGEVYQYLQQLDDALLAWLQQRFARAQRPLTTQQLYCFNAICREAVITPQLTRRRPLEEGVLQQYLSDLLSR